MKPSLFLVAVLVVSSGCRYPAGDQSTTGPFRVEQSHGSQILFTRLTATEVLSIARHLAEQKGISLADYQSPMVSFDSDAGEWWVWFHLKPPEPPGGHFGIRINDRTKHADFFPGE